MANRFGGTTAYMSPAALMRKEESNNDPREDVYSLGVTLMEVLAGANPFFRKSKDEIIEMHRNLDFPIGHLPFWQQSIILKAIHQHAELRFQTMGEFAEAIASKQVPYLFRKEILEAGQLAEKIQKLISSKKWMKAQPLGGIWKGKIS